METLPDYCAQCGAALTVLIHGGRERCCDGLGYWSNATPKPEDRFYQSSVKAPDGTVYYRYIGQRFRWKPGQRKPTAKPKFVFKKK